MRVWLITVSDRCHRGEREDGTGPALADAVRSAGAEIVGTGIVPDDRAMIAGAIRDAARAADVVLTAGGTGLGPRDVTPEATREVIDREAPGFGEEMRRRSLKITNRAVLSRATAGSLGRTFVLNLPGSPKAAVECFSFLREAVEHAVDLLTSDVTDCAQ